MSHPTVAPQSASEKLGLFLFPLRGIPGLFFAAIILLGIGERWGTREWNWGIGLLVLFWGEWMRLYSRRFIGRSSSTRTAKVSHLVTGGPYRYVRNPIYLGNLGILVGFSAISGLWWSAIVFGPLILVLYILIASYEARIVVTQYPEEGTAFVNTVPAWLPRFSGTQLAESDRVAWGEVFWRERKLLIGLGIAVLYCAAREIGWIPLRFF